MNEVRFWQKVRIPDGPDACWLWQGQINGDGTTYGRHLHRLRGPDAGDPLLAWTRCGVRFAWGAIPRATRRLSRCEGCWT